MLTNERLQNSRKETNTSTIEKTRRNNYKNSRENSTNMNNNMQTENAKIKREQTRTKEHRMVQSKGTEEKLKFEFKKENLKIIPLGGLEEIGKNITVFEYGNEIILVDCGLEFQKMIC